MSFHKVTTKESSPPPSSPSPLLILLLLSSSPSLLLLDKVSFCSSSCPMVFTQADLSVSQHASLFFFFHLPFPLGWESIPAWERSVPSRVWPLLSRLLKDCVFSLRSVASNWNESHSHLKGFSKHRTLGLTLESGVEPTSQPAFQGSRPLLRLLLVWRSQVSNNGHSAAVVSFYCILKFERIKKEKNTHPRYPGYNLEQLYQNFRH